MTSEASLPLLRSDRRLGGRWPPGPLTTEELKEGLEIWLIGGAFA